MLPGEQVYGLANEAFIPKPQPCLLTARKRYCFDWNSRCALMYQHLPGPRSTKHQTPDVHITLMTRGKETDRWQVLQALSKKVPAFFFFFFNIYTSNGLISLGRDFYPDSVELWLGRVPECILAVTTVGARCRDVQTCCSHHTESRRASPPDNIFGSQIGLQVMLRLRLQQLLSLLAQKCSEIVIVFWKQETKIGVAVYIWGV